MFSNGLPVGSRKSGHQTPDLAFKSIRAMIRQQKHRKTGRDLLMSRTMGPFEVQQSRSLPIPAWRLLRQYQLPPKSQHSVMKGRISVFVKRMTIQKGRGAPRRSIRKVENRDSLSQLFCYNNPVTILSLPTPSGENLTRDQYRRSYMEGKRVRVVDNTSGLFQ